MYFHLIFQLFRYFAAQSMRVLEECDILFVILLLSVKAEQEKQIDYSLGLDTTIKPNRLNLSYIFHEKAYWILI